MAPTANMMSETLPMTATAPATTATRSASAMHKAARALNRREMPRQLARALKAAPQKMAAPFVLAKGTPAPTPSLAVHAANRLMYGPRVGDITRINALGYDAFVEEQLNPAAIDDSACDTIIAGIAPVTFNETRQQAYDRRNNASWDEVIRPIEETRLLTFVRAVHSKRQLQERMVEFWHDHFNIYGWDSPARSLWADWDKTLRQHTLGNFRTLLEATTTHPCMLVYLDNYISTNSGPNENYARELMELHTLGTMNYQQPGGYIDQDVYETSRCFTGWTYETSSASPTRGEFKYNHDQHDRFIKYVFGTLIPGDRPALADGKQILDMLANHIGTARYLATRLALRFYGENPPADLIESTAQVFYDNRAEVDQIKRTLRHLLKHSAFKNVRMNRFKRPFDWVASAMRALEMTIPTADSFIWWYGDLGLGLYEWRTPDGTPDDNAYWITSNGLLRRWNWAFGIATGWEKDDNFQFDALAQTPTTLKTAREIATFWADRIHQRTVSQGTLEGMIEFVADGRSWDVPLPTEQREQKIQYVAALALMTPEFMYR